MTVKRPGILLLLSLTVALWPPAQAPAQPGRTTPEEARLKGDPNAARPHWQKGAEAYGAAKYNDAVKDFEKAFELYEHWTFQYCIGQAYRKAGNYKRAFQAYERYTKICPKPDPIVWLRIGDCQIKGGGRDWIEPKHKESYQKYLQLEPNGPYAEQPVFLQLEGDFKGFYSFLLALENKARIMRIQQMELEKLTNEQEGQMRADLTISIFFERSGGKE